MTKLELVGMFGTLVFFGRVCKEDIIQEMDEYNFYSQKFVWNDFGVELDFHKEDYISGITVSMVEDRCADYILKKLGKCVEVQL